MRLRLVVPALALLACGKTIGPSDAPPSAPSSSSGSSSSGSSTSSGSSSGSSLEDAGSDDAAAGAPLFGPPTTLAWGFPFMPLAMISDGVDLFMLAEPATGGGPDAIWRLPVAGGTPVQIASGAFGGNPIAVDDENVYFVQGTNAPTAIASVPKAGGSVVVLQSTPTLVGAGFSTGTVTWAESDAPDASEGVPEPMTVKSAPLTAGAPATMLGTVVGEAIWDMVSIATVGTTVFLAGPDLPGGRLDANGTWTPLSGSSDFSRVLGAPGGVYAYDNISAGPPVDFWSVSGAVTTVLAGPPNGNISYLAVDSTYLYFPADGVSALPKSGGPTLTVFHYEPSLRSAAPIAVDETAVYWFLSGEPFEPLLPDGGQVAWAIERASKLW